MLSPITGKPHVKIIHKIPANTIINLYKKDIGIDVSRFFKTVNEVLIAECEDTGFRFYYPENIFADGAFYASLNSKNSGYYKPKRWEHLRALKMIDTNEKVLEVGSGDGAFLKMFSEKGGNITGLEINTEAIANAKKEGITVLPETLETHSESHSGIYDVVVSFQVLEHIYDVKSYFESAIKCLRPGGRLIIGVPNNNPYIFKRDILHTLNLPPHHSGLWSKTAFANIPRFFNLQQEEILIEPLQETKEWYEVQKKYYQKHNKPLALAMSLIPSFVYKHGLKLFSNRIEGRNLLACFKLRPH